MSDEENKKKEWVEMWLQKKYTKEMRELYKLDLFLSEFSELEWNALFESIHYFGESFLLHQINKYTKWYQENDGV